MNPKKGMCKMKVGDLVKVISEWTHHNPWMQFHEDEPKIALVVKTDDPSLVSVYADGKELIYKKTELEVICK